MKRILFVTLEVFGADKKGGGERYVTELARAARARGLSVDVVIVRSMHRFAQVESLDLPAHAITFSRFRDLVRSCDFVHVHQLNTPGFDYSAVLAKLFHKPLILTDHGGGALTPGRLLGRLRLRFIDAAAFVSEWSQQDTDPLRAVHRSTILLGGGDHLPSAAPLDRFYDFGFVGRLIPHKGPHVVVDALPEGASLIIAGQARDAQYFDSLKRLAEGKDVTFVSDASDEFVASLHKSIRHLLVPSVEEYGDRSFSRPELLGLVALEALAAGTPVIGSNVGGLAEVLRMANQVSVQPGNLSEWRAALTRALETPARPVVQSAFTWDAVAKRCETLYATMS